MRVSTINTSFTDYPNTTSLIVYMTGCIHNCDGCHNPKLQNPNYGYDIDISDIVSVYEKRKMCKAVVFSGGDPLYQYDELLRACEIFKKISKICVYTGESISNIPKDLFNYIDILITEPYKRECGALSESDTNQKVWDIIDGVPVENNTYFKINN